MSTKQRPRPRFPSLWHLLCFAIIAFLSFSGLVSLQNAAVAVLSTLYLLLLSKFSFPAPPNPNPLDDTPIFPASKILPAYVLSAGVAGLLLPSLYILHGIYASAGDKVGAAAAAPHLFLLASQVVMEGVTFAAGFSIPVRAFVPVFYNSWRIGAVVEWARTEMVMASLERGGAHPGMVYFGRGIALVNVGLWSFNLFGFLLPVYVPRAFKRYYSPPAKTE